MLLTSFDDKLSMYARLLAEVGLNVQKGQFVQIAFESGYAEELALRVMEYAYERGARHVQLSYTHPRATKAQLTGQSIDDRFFFPLSERVRNDHVVDTEGCYLGLRTYAEPDIFNDIAALSGEHQAASMRMRERFYKEGINKGKVSWCVACPPSPKAAQKVYPELSEGAAFVQYWDAIFRMTMSDESDCIEKWKRLDERLHERRRKLDMLGIRELRFYGEGTALYVGLSEESRWLGGSKETAAGKSFSANVPSFEVFTTPDWRRTEGKVKITRPFNVSGVLVEGLELEFRSGRIVKISATKNEDAYRALIQKDEGARQLGEVALVGRDSPVSQEGVVFNNTLYDENAACHIATGSGYSVCIHNGWNLSKEELEKVGCNNSVTHNDVMISGPGVDVDAITHSGETVALIRDGYWKSAFE